MTERDIHFFVLGYAGYTLLKLGTHTWYRMETARKHLSVASKMFAASRLNKELYRTTEIPEGGCANAFRSAPQSCR
jgi:hypothetical protein